MSRTWVTCSEEETRELGRALARELAPRALCLLHGEMGSGKTVLTQGIAAGLGVDPSEVLSPTFTLIREHAGRARLIHVDLHRLEPGDLPGIALEDLLEADAVVVVEWADRLPPSWRAGARAFRLERLPDGRHQVREVDAAARADGGGERDVEQPS